MHPKTPGCLEIDEEETHEGLLHHVAHRQEHAVAVVAWQQQVIAVDPDEALRTALLAHGRLAGGVDSRQEQHLAFRDEGSIGLRKPYADDCALLRVSQTARTETVLQRPLLRRVEAVHPCILRLKPVGPENLNQPA